MSDGAKVGLSAAGEERRTRMLLELQGTMLRRAKRRRAARRAGVAVMALAPVGVAAGVMWAEWAHRGTLSPRPAAPIVATLPAPVTAATTEEAPRLSHVRLVAVPASARPSARVLGTDASAVSKYVAASSGGAGVEVVSDEELMRALARTGNEFGLIRVGDEVRVNCNSCDDGRAPWERGGDGAEFEGW